VKNAAQDLSQKKMIAAFFVLMVQFHVQPPTKKENQTFPEDNPVIRGVFITVQQYLQKGN
jgi:hypothetical protein